MKLQQAREAGRRRSWLTRPNSGGGATIAWASAAPLVVLVLSVAADGAQVSRFRTQVQLAADAASRATAAAVARHPDEAGEGVATRVGAAVFASYAPPGAAGRPTVVATSHSDLATATVAYDGVAPSNFGSALGYGSFRVTALASSPALVADFQADGSSIP